MKFIVDEMPKSKKKCPFSKWEPYPPIFEETGHYICKITHDDCDLRETGCQLLKQERSEARKVEQEVKQNESAD